jgi:hypothetical protein
MKSLYKITGVLVLLGALLSACEKDIDTYQNDARVYFFERNTDVTATRITYRSYSFLLQPEEVTKDTINIRVKIMGEAASYDRIVRGRRLDSASTTAIEGTHYDFIDGIVPADSIYGYLPVVVYRTADIKDSSVTLNLAIGDTKDFKPGAAEDDYFQLTWSDNVVKPSNWDGLLGLVFYFGTYSDVKWRFIIQVTGKDNFPLQQSRFELKPEEYSNAAMNDIKAQIKDALATYNTANDPDLTDENGQLVVFP